MVNKKSFASDKGKDIKVTNESHDLPIEFTMQKKVVYLRCVPDKTEQGGSSKTE